MIPHLADSQFWQVFEGSTVTTPSYEIMVLLIVTTCCLLTRWTRLGLLLSFVYVYRWGWLFMHQEFSNQPRLLIAYYSTGILVLIGSIIAFLSKHE